ncbi:MAG: MiaB/RimO family radical SAM methylthiotransferase [Oscillospiraceae bacterium]|nr:MiaB/RimO family radical SAM methylthiotransferase [Oscillospiraceae bacterium]
MLFAILTIGCKANQSESAVLAAEMVARGHTQVNWHDAADAYVINTCTVTASSDSKCRAAIRKVKMTRSDAVVAVMGCLSQLEDLSELSVDVALGTDNRGDMVEQLEAEIACRGGTILPVIVAARGKMPSLQRTRHLLKIQDGCDNHCSYCIIPTARGQSWSMSQDEILVQLRSLEDVKEVVVTGIEIASYEPSLSALIAAMCQTRPDIRFRLGSLEPRIITDAFLNIMDGLPNVCRHFHVPLQSGCGATLARMNRQYTTTQFSDCLANIRMRWDDAAITTDFIVGFPGESEAEWEDSLAFFKSCGFAKAHVFPYSQRAGTLAASMDEQVTIAVKKTRAKEAGGCAEKMSEEYARQWVNKKVEVLLEVKKDGLWQGYAENYCLAKVDMGAGDFKNQIVRGIVVSVEGKVLKVRV